MQDVATLGRADWREMIGPYQRADIRAAFFQLVTTLGLLALSFVATYQALDVSVWLSLLLAPLAAGLLVRTFIIMHDCGHGSFLPWKPANESIGFVTGVLTLTPFSHWRHEHALHHSSAGDLERRGHGDVPTITVAEYRARTRWGKLKYRAFRFPGVLLLLGTLHMIVMQRIPPRDWRQARSVWATNAAIAAMFALMIWLVGPYKVMLSFLPAMVIAAATGTWLFYVQHQFEETYWEDHKEWDYATAAIRGSSYLKLHPVLQWFTGNIGLHHVHHLGPRIPNYKLAACHAKNPLFHQATVMTLKSGFAVMRLALWDEERKKLVSFKDVSAAAA